MKDRRKPKEGLFQLKVLYNLFKRHKFAIRKHFLGYLLLGAYPDRNNFKVLAQIFASLADFLFFVVVRRILIKIFLAVSVKPIISDGIKY